MPKICPPITNLKLEPQKVNQQSFQGSLNTHECPKVITITLDLEHFLYRMSICVQFRDSVWRLHKECFLGAMLGPFTSTTFGPRCQISREMILPKKDSVDKMIIIALSFPPWFSCQCKN